MQDIIYVAVLIAFFALAALFVAACDKMIGSDEEALALTQAAVTEAEPEQVAA